ncbi:flagellar assembly protein FliW [Specibacter cremeus]|uniref:flagellar assembly protein FliW n=1 Tax=Specibacter cremeus TaxID=1629051 RepID=UPI000F7B0C95|nr:flagellar assembly protein FliW [Specibacter cremeus]
MSVVRFTAPPPGLEPATEFVLEPVPGAAGLFTLSSGETAARLFVLDASVYLPDYAPRLARTVLESVGLAAGVVPTVLVVANPAAQTTVNLAAPIVLNPVSGACAQVILEGADWPLRHPLAA